MSGDDIVQRLRRWDGGISTHWVGCFDSHPVCAIRFAADAIEARDAEIKRLLDSLAAERAEVERLRRWKAEATTVLKDWDCWAEQGIALLDAINALHHPVPSDKGDEVCNDCGQAWPCQTHRLLHPEEARRG